MAFGYFDARTDAGPEGVKRRRDLARALMATRAPQNTGEGIMALSNGILAAMLNGQAADAEAAGQAAGQAAWAPIAAALGDSRGFPPAPTSGGGAPMATGPNPNSVQSGIDHAQRGEGSSVRDAFMGEVGKTVTNPYALAAIAATGEHESGFDRDNSTRTWSDPSQSGQPGTAGGIMSWRGDRLARLQAFGGGDLSPAKQAAFFLQEDPALISALGNAKSVEEAQSLMNNAWRFAGYDQPGGEAGARLASANAYLPQYQKGGAALEQMAGADPSGEWLRYANQGATRSLPLDQKLTSALSFLPEMGVQMEVFSGGQPGKGEGGARVGSTRHDHGGAADAFFYKNGRKLDWANPDDLPIFEEIVRRGKAAGLTGFGAGEGYMQPGSMHLGFGTPMTWGAGGNSANAPAWLRKAYETQVASLGDPSQFLDQGGRSMSPDAAASVAAASAPAPYRATGVDPAGMVQPTGSTRIAQALSDTRAPEMAGSGAVTPGGGATMDQLIQAMSGNGAAWMPEWQQKILGTLYQQRVLQQDPEYQLGLEKTRTELDLLKNPRLSPYEEAQIGFKRTEQEAAAAKAKQEQANADRSFGLDERKFTSESEDRAADNAREDAKYLLTTQPDFYNEYVKQEIGAGRTPLGILDYAKQLKQAGATNISNVNGSGNSSKFTEESDKAAAARMNDIVTAGNGAAEFLGDIQQLGDLGKMIGTGKEAELKTSLGPWAGMLGIDIGELGPAQAYESIVARLAPQMRPAGSGATSDFDARQFLRSLPSLGNTPEGNMILTETFSALQQHRMKAAEIASQSFLPQDDPNFLTWQEAEKRIRSLPNPYEGFNRWRKDGTTTGSSSGPAPKPPMIINGYTIEQVSP